MSGKLRRGFANRRGWGARRSRVGPPAKAGRGMDRDWCGQRGAPVGPQRAASRPPRCSRRQRRDGSVRAAVARWSIRMGRVASRARPLRNTTPPRRPRQPATTTGRTSVQRTRKPPVDTGLVHRVFRRSNAELLEVHLVGALAGVEFCTVLIPVISAASELFPEFRIVVPGGAATGLEEVIGVDELVEGRQRCPMAKEWFRRSALQYAPGPTGRRQHFGTSACCTRSPHTWSAGHPLFHATPWASGHWSSLSHTPSQSRSMGVGGPMPPAPYSPPQ